MFAPLVAKPKSSPPERSAVPAQRRSQAAVAEEQLLQRTIGNQAMLPLLAQRLPGYIQAKLKVGAVDDPLEHEADRVADQVMRMPEPSAAARPVVSSNVLGVQRKCSCGGSCDKCKSEPSDDKHGRLHRKPTAAGDLSQKEAPPIVHEALRSPGQPLDAATRAFMERRFGHDFSHVRVHTGPEAADFARSIAALAYTTGEHMVFDHRRYQPDTIEGRRLIAHELTHVVQ
jgi:hypothetical protein